MEFLVQSLKAKTLKKLKSGKESNSLTPMARHSSTYSASSRSLTPVNSTSRVRSSSTQNVPRSRSRSRIPKFTPISEESLTSKTKKSPPSNLDNWDPFGPSPPSSESEQPNSTTSTTSSTSSTKFAAPKKPVLTLDLPQTSDTILLQQDFDPFPTKPDVTPVKSRSMSTDHFTNLLVASQTPRGRGGSGLGNSSPRLSTTVDEPISLQIKELQVAQAALASRLNRLKLQAQQQQQQQREQDSLSPTISVTQPTGVVSQLDPFAGL